MDRVWLEVVRNGAGQALALTHRFYDANNQAPAVIGAAGDLTRVSAVFDLPPQTGLIVNTTLHSRDTTNTYDSYGNRLTETSYAVAGTRLYTGSAWTIGAAGSGSAAQTTNMTYDPTFHVFVTKGEQPPASSGAARLSEQGGYDYRMGTLTSVTDVNGNATSATYDVFGRLVTLVKPGDTSSYPTLQAYYADNEQPFRYRIDRREGAGTTNVRVEQQLYDGLGRKIQIKAESANGTQNIVTDTRFDALGRVKEQSQPRYVNETSGTFYTYTNPGTGALYRPTSTTYDGLDRPIRSTTPDAKWSEHAYGLTGNLIYDDLVDPNRHRVQRRFVAPRSISMASNAAHRLITANGALARLLAASEVEVMRVVWARGPLTVRAISAEIATRRTVAYTTTLTTCVRLADKGLLRRAKVERGVVYIYTPTIGEQDFVPRRVWAGVEQVSQALLLGGGQFGWAPRCRARHKLPSA